MAFASTALATSAQARDGAWYVGAEGGGMIVEDSDFDLGATSNAVTVEHNKGFDVDGVIGYDFGPFRTEFEVGYKDANLDSVTTSVAGVPGGGGTSGLAGGGQPAGTYESADGNTRVLSFMLNGLLDFGNDDGWNASIGGGAGIARVKQSDYQLAKFGSAFANDSDSKFAWQVIAAVRRALTQNVDVGLKYRFFNVDNIKTIAATGADMKGDLRSHSLLLSLIYNFGEPPAPPPPPPPPPPAEPAPPPPPPPPAVPGPFIVFFDWDKSDITPEAASILDNAAAAYQETGQASVMLAGHADKSGSDQYNVGLSQRRADAAKAYLAGKGVPDTAISTEAFGESRPLVDTADGVREPQNRRVEITFGPGSGM
jgi:outer membrane protein OmpA-like peptidoglycan-associated protein